MGVASEENGTESPDFPSIDMKSNGHSQVSIPPQKSLANVKTNSIRSESNGSSPIFRCMGDNILTMGTLLGVVLGLALGLGLRSVRDWQKRDIMYVNFPGELFLNMLKCLILPLIVSSLVSAIGGLDTRLTGKIGFRAVAYYLTTTVLAIVLGIILVISIRPGRVGMTSKLPPQEPRPTLTQDTLMDLVRNMFPPNILQACIYQYGTVLIKPTNATENDTDYNSWDFHGKMSGSTNILGLVVFSVVLGIMLGEMGHKGKPLLDVFTSLSNVMMSITKLVIWLSPVGILFLVASKILEMEDFAAMAEQVGLYFITVLAGVLVHGFVVLPLIYLALVRKNPLVFIIRMGQAMATAFGTASSSATLPVTIACLEDKIGVDPRVSRFCLPIGATMNMDGTALYEAVAAIFIAQVRGVTLSAGSIISISITATAASIGAAGIPQAGLVTMVMVLNVVGLPPEDVSLILVVDWILDRFRTLINVLGDAFGSAIVDHYSKQDLEEMTNNSSSSSEDHANLEMTNL